METCFGLFDREELISVICLFEDLGSLQWYGKEGLEMRRIEKDDYIEFKDKHHSGDKE